ncbi:MAG TPA: nucleoside monophosphate kinase, partial [Acidimicrobiales bacterium]|nr:nucleoside monophosphate kinase [Acidimicrobiales bacterium]
RHYVVPHISTGDILRAAVREGTEFGKKAKAIMDAGDLVPDDIMVGIVDERLDRDDTRSRGFILDGFPRTVAQAAALLEITSPRGIDLVVNLEVARDVVLARLASRRTCSDCGTNYSTDRPPRYNATCDVCGGEVIQREDDTEDAINRRLDLYEAETSPLIDWFTERDLLLEVDGDGDPDVVFTRVVDAIDRAREGRR